MIMTGVSVNYKTTLNEILDEAERNTLNPFDLSLIVGGYDDLINASQANPDLNPAFIRQSLATALHLAQIGLDAKYLGSALLYYPVILGVIEIESVQKKYPLIVSDIIANLFALDKAFAGFLPWIQSQTQTLPGSNSRPEPASENKKKVWEKQTARLILSALLSLA